MDVKASLKGVKSFINTQLFPRLFSTFAAHFQNVCLNF